MRMANVNGIHINYRVEGQGEPLIMIAGLDTEQSAWGSQIESFKKYYRTVTFDNRGVGKSDKPAGPYTIKMMADDTLGLIDHIGIEKAHIIGASMGGTIAQELAINHPERVNKLVLACTLARRDRTSGFTSKFNKALDAYDKSSRSEADLRRFTSVYISLRVNKRPNRIERARSLARELLFPLMKIVLRFPATTGLPEQLEAFSTHDATDRLGMIKASTLVITGTEDRLIKPISSEVIANLVPKAKLVKVPGGSHSFIMEMSDEFNREVLDFLKN